MKSLPHYRHYQNDELLQLLAKDDEHAFSEIYERYWKTLYGVAYSRLRDTYLTEDVVHEVLTSLWRNRTETIHSLESYLASATKYQVFSVFRKNERFNRYRRSASSPLSSTADPEIYLHHKQLLELIADEVEALPERCRLIFKNSRERGMTAREIAMEMKISPKTVENQLHKALHHLRFSMRKIMQLFFL